MRKKKKKKNRKKAKEGRGDCLVVPSLLIAVVRVGWCCSGDMAGQHSGGLGLVTFSLGLGLGQEASLDRTSSNFLGLNAQYSSLES
jgi:hypothetical protein